MKIKVILFFVAIYVCAYTQDHSTSHVTITREKQLIKVESPEEQKSNSAENSIEGSNLMNEIFIVLSKNIAKILIKIKSDLIQNLTTVSLFETNKNITSFSQEPYKLNDSFLNNSKNNNTKRGSDNTSLNEVEKSANDLINNAANDFPAVNIIKNTSQTSPDSLNKNNHDNSTTSEKNVIKDYPVNNSSEHKINRSDENITLNNNTINDHSKRNVSYSTIGLNPTLIQESTEQIKISDVNNYTTHNESVITTEDNGETVLPIDPNITYDSEESTSEDDTLTFDIGDILGTHDMSEMVEEFEEEEEDDDESGDDDEDDDGYTSLFDSSEDESESQKPTKTKNAVKENKKELNQKSKGFGIFPKLVIFSINVGFVFVAFWLTKTFMDKRMFQEVFSPNIPPNGNFVGHSEIFLHKSVQVFILKQTCKIWLYKQSFFF